MGSIEELVKRNKKENLVLSLIIIIVCVLSLMLNFNNYFRTLSNEYYEVTNLENLNTAIKNKERFISVDLRDAKLEMYSLKEEKKTEHHADIYTLSLDEMNILVLIKPNTMITDKVPLEILNDDNDSYQIKNKLKDNDYYAHVLSNVDYNFNRKFELIKFYITIGLLVVSLISIVVSFNGVLNPSKTYAYKKYNKKLYM